MTTEVDSLTYWAKGNWLEVRFSLIAFWSAPVSLSVVSDGDDWFATLRESVAAARKMQDSA